MTGGPSPWVGQASEHHDGVDAAQSGPLAKKQRNWLKISVTGPKIITFWWKTSSKTGGELRCYVDARRMATRSGNTGWQQRSILIGRGTHDVKWMFIRDASGSAGMNASFLDQVRITAPAGRLKIVLHRPRRSPRRGRCPGAGCLCGLRPAR